MKKGIALYLTFAVLCAFALALCVTGCKGNDTPVSTSSAESATQDEQELVNSRYDNDDYDRGDVSNKTSRYTVSDTGASGHSPASRIITTSSKKSSSSKASSSSEESSVESSSSTSSSSSSTSTPSKSTSSAGYDSDGNMFDVVSKGEDEGQWGEWKPL